MAKATQASETAARDQAADNASKDAYEGGRVEIAAIGAHVETGSMHVSGGQAPTIYTETAVSDNTVMAGGIALKVKKHVAMPVLPFVEGMTIVCRIVDAIHKGKAIEENSRGAAKMETPMVCTIMSLSGEMRTLIAGAVLHKELEEAYQNDGYVGGWFHITRLPIKAGKRYSTFVINEIEPPTKTDMDAFRRQEAQAALPPPANPSA